MVRDNVRRRRGEKPGERRASYSTAGRKLSRYLCTSRLRVAVCAAVYSEKSRNRGDDGSGGAIISLHSRVVFINSASQRIGVA